MVQVLSAVAPGAEYTSLWLSNSTVQPVHVDSQNLQGSTNVVLPVKLPRGRRGTVGRTANQGMFQVVLLRRGLMVRGTGFLGVTHQLPLLPRP